MTFERQLAHQFSDFNSALKCKRNIEKSGWYFAVGIEHAAQT
jgi:hypothetical protein